MSEYERTGRYWSVLGIAHLEPTHPPYKPSEDLKKKLEEAVVNGDLAQVILRTNIKGTTIAYENRKCKGVNGRDTSIEWAFRKGASVVLVSMGEKMRPDTHE